MTISVVNLGSTHTLSGRALFGSELRFLKTTRVIKNERGDVDKSVVDRTLIGLSKEVAFPVTASHIGLSDVGELLIDVNEYEFILRGGDALLTTELPVSVDVLTGGKEGISRLGRGRAVKVISLGLGEKAEHVVSNLEVERVGVIQISITITSLTRLDLTRFKGLENSLEDLETRNDINLSPKETNLVILGSSRGLGVGTTLTLRVDTERKDKVRLTLGTDGEADDLDRGVGSGRTLVLKGHVLELRQFSEVQYLGFTTGRSVGRTRSGTSLESPRHTTGIGATLLGDESSIRVPLGEVGRHSSLDRGGAINLVEAVALERTSRFGIETKHTREAVFDKSLLNTLASGEHGGAHGSGGDAQEQCDRRCDPHGAGNHVHFYFSFPENKQSGEKQKLKKILLDREEGTDRNSNITIILNPCM